MEGNDPNEVTIVVSRKIKPGYEKEYDDWLRRYLAIERKASGYLGTTIIMYGGTNSAVRYIIHRFTDKRSMREWENSQESLKLLDEANNYSIQMAIVIFIAAYTISSLSRSIINPFLAPSPLLANTAFYTGILVVLLTYFAMPVLSRCWLYPTNVRHIDA
jgi:uncharacterized protein